jgi:hypothetical protein
MRAFTAPKSRHFICRLHNVDVKQSVMLDTWPKMMELAFPGVHPIEHLSDQYYEFPNGAEVWFGGLDDKGRVEKILGKEYATIYVNEASQVSYDSVITLRTRLAQKVKRGDGRFLKLKAYYDLNPVGKGHWTYKEFVDGIRPENGIPFERKVRAFAVMNPKDNPHLPEEYIQELDAMPERQRLRYMEGKYQTEVPGALWPSDLVESLRVSAPPVLYRIVVAIDPSGSNGVGGDSQGIVVAGVGEDGHAYILEDCSVLKSPKGWAQVAVDAYHKWGADCIVAETNYGGAMVEAVIRGIAPNIPYKAVTASRGKHVRAEPVASLYELGKAHHVGRFPELEEQMGMFTTRGYEGSGSPDRADAMVWAVTELAIEPIPDAGIFELYRQDADTIEKAEEAEALKDGGTTEDADQSWPDFAYR